MNDSIRLHETKGLNPHLTVCPRCGKDSDEIILLGAKDKVYICNKCGTKQLGTKFTHTCQKCGAKYTLQAKGTLDEHERLPATDMCDDCKKELDTFKAEIAAGGIYWRCVDCNATGIIKGNAPFAKAVRKQHELTNGEPCGVEFNCNDCPACSGE